MSLSCPRVLLIDSYDSFTHNLAALCRKAIPDAHIYIIRNDQLSIQELSSILPQFAAVIVGPGPGSPDVPADIGVVSRLWTLHEHELIPVFGVCLGLQSLSIEFGARLKRLNVVKHGQISQIHHDGTGLFKGIGETYAVRYHSLHVVLQDDGNLEPLAWADDGFENGQVVMAVKHRTRPFWAVQYHPESVRTSEGGLQVLQNFWRLAKSWYAYHGRVPQPWSNEALAMVGPSWPQPSSSTLSPSQDDVAIKVTASVLHIPGVPVVHICDLLGAQDESSPFVLLESAAQPGRFSIIGCVDSDSTKLTYTLGDKYIRLSRGPERWLEQLGSMDVWSWLTSFMRSRRATDGPSGTPFWGGLIGYIGYELGLESLQVPLPFRKGTSQRRHPDLNLVFVERSVVVDRHFDRVYIQSLKANDGSWLCEVANRLTIATPSPSNVSPHDLPPLFSRPPTIHLPDESLYKSRILAAKDYLASGDSYELCLTAHTNVTVQLRPRLTSSSWDLYKLLRKNNPAPHSGYIRLQPSTLLSSSPERFLSYSRPPYSRCQLRPIKGTVRKAPGITRTVAEELLAGSKKEVAENLMIVDLIRHDLHGVVGEDVSVKQFCRVEEYETVWQLVSVIEGAASGSESGDEYELGWEVLRKSLPPGSMTGAPKKRSVEILQTLEDNDRSIYSGVFGYWDAGGGGDWSVVIRSCFKYDEPSHNEPTDSSDLEFEEWTIGAGGAITALSDPDAEWDEMTAKLQSVLRTFEAAAGKSDL
ncbi:para-aminobenzoic acid synthetase [Gloeopeniophorella convolvens]|nr:para-aminobenzoic acid synthetase [Gloeopeniophorella convolvens]